MISKNVVPEIIKTNRGKKRAKESGCCFRSCGGVPCIQQEKGRFGMRIKKILNKARG